MRKIVSLLLALMIATSLSTVAFAEETGDRTSTVYGSYVDDNSEIATVYSVGVEWTTMEFTYHAAVNAAVWNPDNHTYEGAQDAYWEGTGTITVENHSNVSITASASYTANSGFESASMTFSPASLNLQSAAVNSKAETGSITVTPSGTLPKIDSKTAIGTITVTIDGEESAEKTPLEEAKELLAEAEIVYAALNYQNLNDELKKAYTDLNDGIDQLEVMIGWGEAGDESAWQDADYDTLEEAFNEVYATYFRKYNELKAAAGI